MYCTTLNLLEQDQLTCTDLIQRRGYPMGPKPRGQRSRRTPSSTKRHAEVSSRTPQQGEIAAFWCNERGICFLRHEGPVALRVAVEHIPASDTLSRSGAAVLAAIDSTVSRTV